MKLGSLFDGSGGFPLAGVMNGIEPVWASEIEPYPLRVTAARFPQMKQLGDVTKINGAEIEKVDIITFGSPCQDLSVAGKQKGIHEGERSNLFFEAVRIIKEMRDSDRTAGRADEHIRPRFEEISGTLQAKNEGGFSLNFVNPIVYDQQRFGQYGNSGTASSLKARDYKDATDLIVYADRRYIVRRLTPLECCRLQGFPDNWEDGVQGSDSARYKMWGNGIALPCAADVLRRIAKEIKRDETTD